VAVVARRLTLPDQIHTNLLPAVAAAVVRMLRVILMRSKQATSTLSERVALLILMAVTPGLMLPIFCKLTAAKLALLLLG
jgi:nitrogen fixation/metabolism regulation signal transduction histidine kinase